MKARGLGVVVILLLVMSYSVSLQAGQSSAGAQFLSIYPGIRGTAQGGAFTVGIPSAQVIFWNPAGAVGVTQNKVFFSNANYFAGMKFGNIAVVLPVGAGIIGFQGIGLFSGEILETTEEMADGTGDYYTANDIAVGVSYARMMTNKFNAGVTIKFVYQSIAKVHAQGLAFDLGAIYKTGLIGNLRLGFTLRNFGADMQYRGEDLIRFTGISDNPFEEEDVKYELVSEKYMIPTSFSMGFAVDLPFIGGQKLTLNFDGGNSVDQKETARIGLEYQLPGIVYLGVGHGNLRALFSPGASDESLGGNMKGWALGGGINFGYFFGREMWIEFSYEDHKYLQGIQRYGLELSF